MEEIPSLEDPRLARLRAVEELALGRDRQALEAYRQLSKLVPHEPAYTVIAQILERRLAERCRRADAEDPTCE